ncbi:MAG: DeoR/GlpR transcriptional regulator [Clostridia bacterium]|nr:DeoR/GlpR transcriptional regulator [Clostridia bacterium]
MPQKIRQEQILNILNQQGYVTVRYLSDTLQYSTATINRDLNAMQSAGLVKRSYGGVEAVSGKHLPPLIQRQFYHRREKRRIAELAVEQIQNGDTVFLDGSTTAQYMAPFLGGKKDLRIITNSLRLAMELGECGHHVVCLGGHIIEHPYVLGGEETVENAMRYRPDKMFFSVGYITADGLIRAAQYLFYKTMLKNSAQAWFLTDRTKLTERVSTVLCDFSALTGVISDFDFPEETKAKYSNAKFIVAK